MCTQHVQTSQCLSCVSKLDIPGASYILNLDFEMRRLPWFNHLSEMEEEFSQPRTLLRYNYW